MILEALVGKHTLYRVDTGIATIDWDKALPQIEADGGSVYEGSKQYEDASALSFDLDGEVYTALEDPEDGYRSALATILVGCVPLFNRFTGVKVFCVLRNSPGDKVLDMYDMESGLVILSIGTEDTDDYYPVFVAEFNPKNMAINRKSE